MKIAYRFSTGLLFLFSSFVVNACDICGCGAGTSYLGMLPEYNNNIIGLRYRKNAMRTHLGMDNKPTYLTTDENFNILEAWAAIKIATNFRAMTQIPYSFISKTNLVEQSTINKTGIGDAQLLAQYHLVNKKFKLPTKLLVLDAWIGGGLKLPTGKYNSTNQINSVNLFQLGTGSWDVMTQAAIDIRLQNIGLNINGMYKINTANALGYYYGNKLGINAQIYYKWSVGRDKNLVPNIGMSYEHNRKDQNKDVVLDATGGYIARWSLGMEIKWVKYFLGMQYQPIMSQNIGLNQIEVKDNISVHFGLNF